MQHDGLVQAGIPIGTHDYVLGQMRSRVAAAERVHEQTRLLECVQSAYLISRYCLSRKMDYHSGSLGADIMGGSRERWWADDGSDSPGALHDRQMRQTLAVLLTSPYLPSAARQAARADALPAHVAAQAMLAPRHSGVGHAPVQQTADACFVAQGLAILSFLFTHCAALHLPADLRELQGLAWGQQLEAAVARLPAPRTGANAGVALTLDGLLSGSQTSRSQHRLTEDVYVKMYEDTLALQPSSQHRARLVSAAGAYAGAWLGVLPSNDGHTALPGEYRLALCLRLGMPLHELEAASHTRCSACDALLDVYGFHPGTCKAGNAGGAWTQRSHRLEGALAFVANRMGVYAVRVGNANWFGVAGWDPLAKNGRGAYRMADVVLVGFCGGGQRHLFIDVAVVDGSGAAGTRGVPGAAASAREAAKVRKYRPICDRIGAQFRGAAIERHGHCGDGMCSIIKLLSGDGARDLMQEDTSFTASSRTTYVAQHVVFAAVMADAALVDDALRSALHRIPRGRGARG